MTLIIGIRCSDGIVLGADGAATYGVMGQQTIRQPMRKKLKIIDGQVVIGTSGPIGLGQRFAGELEAMWKGGAFTSTPKPGRPDLSSPHMAMTGIREVFWRYIDYEMTVARSFAQSTGAAAFQKAITTTVVAMPVANKLCLFQFDEQGAPEEATEELPFVAIGSGQQIADPFLAFLRRIYWPDRLPSVSEGVVSTVWTLHHAIETNPGGIGDPMQIVTLSAENGRPRASTLPAEEIETEHRQAVKDAEKRMEALFKLQESPDPPAPPAP